MTSVACTYGALSCWSRILYRAHFKRLMLFALAGTLTSGIGLGLYVIEVSRLDQNKLAMRPVNWLPVTLIGFGLNLLIFRERKVPRRRSGKRWAIVALVATACSNGLFATLNFGLDVHYIEAQAITTVVVGAIHYVLTHRKVFAEESVQA